QVDPRVDGGVEHAPRLVVGRGDAFHEGRRLAERHGTEAQRADAQSALSQLSKFHVPLLWWRPGLPLARAGWKSEMVRPRPLEHESTNTTGDILQPGTWRARGTTTHTANLPRHAAGLS